MEKENDVQRPATARMRRGVFPWETWSVPLSCLSHHHIIPSLHPNILVHDELYISAQCQPQTSPSNAHRPVHSPAPCSPTFPCRRGKIESRETTQTPVRTRSRARRGSHCLPPAPIRQPAPASPTALPHGQETQGRVRRRRRLCGQRRVVQTQEEEGERHRRPETSKETDQYEGERQETRPPRCRIYGRIRDR